VIHLKAGPANPHEHSIIQGVFIAGVLA